MPRPPQIEEVESINQLPRRLPQIEDCGRINESGLFPRSPPMGVFERINGLGHRANLHSASQRNFALSGISASYRAGFRQWLFPKESTG